MRSWTHRPLWNVNASTRGFDIAPEPATRRAASGFDLVRRDPPCANMRERPVKRKDAFYGPFAFLCGDA